MCTKTWRTSRLLSTVRGRPPALTVCDHVCGTRKLWTRNLCIAAAVALWCAVCRSEFGDDTATMWLHLHKNPILWILWMFTWWFFYRIICLCFGSVWTCNWLQIEISAIQLAVTVEHHDGLWDDQSPWIQTGGSQPNSTMQMMWKCSVLTDGLISYSDLYIIRI